MSPERAVEIIENLVDGIHPLTGEILPENNICEEIGIVDALNCAIKVLNERIVAERAIEEYCRQQVKEFDRKQTKETCKKPEKLGKRWTPDDDALLKTMFEEEKSIREMMKALQRSEKGIKFRLEHLRLIEDAENYPKDKEENTRFDNDDLRYRFLHGETVSQIAERYGQTEQASQR